MGMKMLATTDHNISEIAQSVGFGFWKLFHGVLQKEDALFPDAVQKTDAGAGGAPHFKERPEEDYS